MERKPRSPDRPLCDLLRTREQQLYNRVLHLIAEAERILPHIVATFPTGTAHGPDHTRSVESIGSLLLPTEFLSELNDYELFMLILACHFHDLGMTGTERDNADDKSREQVRRDHAVRIAEALLTHWESLGFESQQEAAVLGEICRGHRPEKTPEGRASWTSMPRSAVASLGRTVRMRLLSALIYACDELHIGHDRAQQRIENRVRIENEESRKHWRRHQQIRGPALVDDMVQFDVIVETLCAEDDLRTNVLKKALLAVSDLAREARDASVLGEPRRVLIRWDRSRLWKLILIEQLADLQSRTMEEILQSVESRYSDLEKSASLAGLCVETNNEKSDRVTEIRAQVQDFMTRRYMVSSPDSEQKLILSTTADAHAAFERVLRIADETDSLFRGPHAAVHTFRLFRNEYGRQHVTGHVVPRVQENYSVYLPNEPGVPLLWELFQASPTSCQLAILAAPLPSALEKRDSLAIIAMAGFLIDALRDPTLLLDVDLRKAAKSTASYITTNLGNSLRFLEELALVGGLTPAQVRSCLTPSKELLDELAPESEHEHEKPIQIRMTQQIPREAAFETIAFPYLFLASRRAGVPIRLKTNSPMAPEEFTVEGLPAEDLQGGYSVEMVRIGPGQSDYFPVVNRPCEIIVDPSAASAIIRAFEFTDPTSESCPFLVRIEIGKALKRNSPTTNVTFDTRLHRMCLRDVTTVRTFSNVTKQAEMTLRLVNGATGDEQGIAILTTGQEWVPFVPVEDEIVRTLIELDPQLPLPLFADTPRLQQLLRTNPQERREVYEMLKASERSTHYLTTCVLRRCAADGKAIFETFLRPFPGKIFNAPTIESGPDAMMTQEQVNAAWENPTASCALTTILAADPFQVEQKIIEWIRKPWKKFPIRLDKKAPTPHDVNAVFKLEMRPHVEHFWYTEVPIIFEVRSPTREESLAAEHRYWTSIGDNARASLVLERLHESVSGALDEKRPSPEPCEPDGKAKAGDTTQTDKIARSDAAQTNPPTIKSKRARRPAPSKSTSLRTRGSVRRPKH